MKHLFHPRSISVCTVAVLMLWMGAGGTAATNRPSAIGDANNAVAPASKPRVNFRPTETKFVSLTSTTAVISVTAYGFAPSGELAFTDLTTGDPVAPPVTLNTATGTTILFPEVTTNTGANSLPDWTELADLNGDKILDLVTSLSGTDSITVRLGNGSGGFGMPQTILIATGFAPGEVHAVSLRGNGILDLIVASTKSNQFAVLLGNGSGGFGSPAFYTAGSSMNIPSSLASGDFNDDGNLDVAVANSVDGTVSIFLGNGNGALTESGTPISVGNNPKSIRAGDFNADGYSDLAVANFGDGTVTTLLNNQNGTFTPTVISIGSGAGSGPRALAINGAGSSLQLAVANFNDDTVSALQSVGDGTFGAQTIVKVGSGPDDVRWADINGDGIQDLVVANYTSGTLSVAIGSAGGSYTVLGPFKTGPHPDSAAVGDLNGDGAPDIVVSNYSNDTTQVHITGSVIAVPYDGLSLPPGNSLNATYTPDETSQNRTSTSPTVIAP